MDINLNNVESDLNKSTNVNTDQASNTKYPSVKAVFDWATNLFFPKPTGTTAQYLRGDGSLDTFPTIPDVTGLQSKAVVVSTNQTAVNDAWYINVANATYTDPSPIEGRGFTVDVLNATATINSVAYSIVGTRIVRRFHSGSWITIVSLPDSNFVPTTRTINGLDLSANRTLTASDVGAPSGSGSSTNTNTGDNFILTGAPVQGNAGTSGALRYIGFSDNQFTTTETSRRVFIPKACTLKNFYVRTSGTQPASGNHVLTILKNGVATSIVVTIPAGSSAGIFSDITNQEAFAQGDEISIQAVNNASTTSAIIVSYSIGVL
jgi:hypothetical protein